MAEIELHVLNGQCLNQHISAMKKVKEARGYTQEYMAKKLGIEQTVYSKIENDRKSKIREDRLEEIAKVLGVSVEDIKSPTPIIMNFNNSTQSDVYGTQYNHGFDKETMQYLIKLLDSLQNHMANQNKLIELLLKRSEKL
jgi:putative transcriptional regulator